MDSYKYLTLLYCKLISKKVTENNSKISTFLKYLINVVVAQLLSSYYYGVSKKIIKKISEENYIKTIYNSKTLLQKKYKSIIILYNVFLFRLRYPFKKNTVLVLI